MKVLLSAYACEPNKGSEPGLGWNWALEVARLGHEVWVLTRANNQLSIESMKLSLPEKNNLHFLYYDLPRWVTIWKKGNKGIYLYYFLWQIGAYLFAKTIHRKVVFNIVHHVTFASIRQPSFMGNLAIPFIFGPVAGGERAPLKLRYSYGFRGWIIDLIRDIENFIVKIDPFMWITFHQADQIYVTCEQTSYLLPRKFRKKTQIKLAVGIERPRNLTVRREKSTFRVLYVGRFLYLKGMKIGIQAFARLLETAPNSILTMIGDGPDKKKWKNLAMEHGIEENIVWLPWIAQSELFRIYCQHDVFLFPSLHDSGGQVVLEAMAHGLPIVCIDLGGPKIIVDKSCGYKVPAKDLSEEQIVDQIYRALSKLAKSKKIRKKLSLGAINRINDFTWTSLAKTIYKDTSRFIKEEI